MSKPMIIFVLFVVLFAAVGIRLFWLQIVSGSDLSAAAEARRTNVVTLTAKRGTIYDRNGNVLAMSVDCKTIYCNPKEVKDVSAVAKIIAADLGGSDTDYISSLSKDTTFVYIKRKVDSSVADKLKSDLSSANLKGIYYLSDTKRIYPYGQVAGQVLGLVGTDGQGLSGIELQYNDALSGTDGQMIMEQGSDGTPIAGGTSEVTDAKDGTDIVLSIDIDIQQEAEEKIVQAVKDYSAETGLVMITNPKTGEIIAACSTPLFDPSASSVDTTGMALKLVSNSYEPGSMFKVLTMSIGIENGLITPDTVYDVPAQVKVGDDYVHDDDNRSSAESMTVREIMRRSSNTGAVLAGYTDGIDLFTSGISAFGIGQKTGIDYPGEEAGILTAASDYTKTTLGVNSFGQGLAVPMVQIVRAISAVANDGVLTTPHFLIAKNGSEVAWNETSRACSSSTANQLVDMMRTVVKEGTATAAQVDGYDIVGKTGTGEQAGANGYIANSYLASMVGFTVSTDPELLCYVGLNGTPHLATSSACPTFSSIMGEALSDMGV